jgi:hypothetical protein
MKLKLIMLLICLFGIPCLTLEYKTIDIVILPNYELITPELNPKL